MDVYIQFKQGVLEFCIFGLLKKEPFNGYDLEKQLSSQFKIPEGAIYPLLYQLTKSGHIHMQLAAINGLEVKVYTLSDKGFDAFNDLNNQWHSFVQRVDAIIQ